MPIRMSATWNGADKMLGRLSGMADRARDLSRPADLFAKHLVQKTAKILRSGERGIKSHSSQLEKSLTYKLGQEGGFHSISVGTNKKYGASQQWGPRGGFYASSRPGGFLAIPAGDNLTAAFNARYDSPRDVPDGFFIPSKKPGTLLFVEEIGKTKKGKRRTRSKMKGVQLAAGSAWRNLRLLFVLKKQVPGKAHKYATFDESDRKRWDEIVRHWIMRGR